MARKLLVMWKDGDGLPRAYAVGPVDDPGMVRDVARQMLDAYFDSKRGKITPDRSSFTVEEKEFEEGGE